MEGCSGQVTYTVEKTRDCDMRETTDGKNGQYEKVKLNKKHEGGLNVPQ